MRVLVCGGRDSEHWNDDGTYHGPAKPMLPKPVEQHTIVPGGNMLPEQEALYAKEVRGSFKEKKRTTKG